MARETAMLALAVAAVVGAAYGAPLDNSPEQIHIAYGNAEGSAMTFSWITPLHNVPTDDAVFLGEDPQDLTEAKGQGFTTSYEFVSTYTPNTPYQSGLIHHFTATGLRPSTAYYYTIGLTSGLYKFTTPPTPQSEASWVFGIIGDLGQTANSTQTMAHLLADKNIQTTILVGDLSYADSAWDPSLFPCSQTRWDSWGKMVEPLAATRPMMVLPGNHEVEQEGPPPATQEQFLAYRSRFKMPYEDSLAQNGSLYYSFNVGSVHWIMLNSYMDFNVSSVQYDWLVKDLAGIDRTVTPWIVACMHAPWYNSNSHHHNEFEEVYMRTDMEPLLYKAGVDLVFSGHVHAYERMYPVYQNVTTTGAPVFINVGDGGNREGLVTEYLDPVPTWSAFREAAFGHGRLEIFNSTHAHFGWHKTAAPDVPSSDDVWVIKNHFLGLFPKGSTAFGKRLSPM